MQLHAHISSVECAYQALSVGGAPSDRVDLSRQHPLVQAHHWHQTWQDASHQFSLCCTKRSSNAHATFLTADWLSCLSLTHGQQQAKHRWNKLRDTAFACCRLVTKTFAWRPFNTQQSWEVRLSILCTAYACCRFWGGPGNEASRCSGSSASYQKMQITLQAHMRQCTTLACLKKATL